MPENRACAVHNFRWKRPNGRVSWTYRTLIAALSAERHQPSGAVLEQSTDNGESWQAADVEVRSTDTTDDIACGGVIELPAELRDALAAQITPEMQAKQDAARERIRERNQRLGVRSTDTTAHDLDRMGICRRCGQGITAKELLDGEDRCATNETKETK